MAQVCLRWNIDRGVGVIPESGSLEHIKENITGIYDWKLPADLKVSHVSNPRFCVFCICQGLHLL